MGCRPSRAVRRGRVVLAGLLGAWAAACSADAPPEPSDGAQAQSCPASWTRPDGTVLDFTVPAPVLPASTLPFGSFVQDTDSARGVPDASVAALVSAHFAGGELVLLGKAEDEGEASYLAALGSLAPDVTLALALDATDATYQSVEGQLAGLASFSDLVAQASGGTRTIARLVYQKDGGRLTPDEVVELSGRMPTGVSLATFGSIGGATPSAPAGWTGPYGALVETYGLFSHDCERPGQRILVDGPAGGVSLCGDTCTCLPAGTASIYDLCADSPAQAGRIAGYLASLKAVPVSGSLTGVEFIFSFEPSAADPTLYSAAWTPAEYTAFVAGFADTLRSEAGVTSGGLRLGTWDMTSAYASANGWL